MWPAMTVSKKFLDLGLNPLPSPLALNIVCLWYSVDIANKLLASCDTVDSRL